MSGFVLWVMLDAFTGERWAGVGRAEGRGSATLFYATLVTK